MKRRLVIARALINRPELVLLDEPTTGLDPQARHLLWERLYRLKRDGVTLVITTHYMDEAEQLCDRLVIMDEARIVAAGLAAPAHRRARHPRGGRAPLRHFPNSRTLRSPGSTASGALEPVADRVLVYTDHGDDTAAAVHERGLRPESVLVRRSSLEDVFLRLTGRQLDE